MRPAVLPLSGRLTQTRRRAAYNAQWQGDLWERDEGNGKAARGSTARQLAKAAESGSRGTVLMRQFAKRKTEAMTKQISAKLT